DHGVIANITPKSALQPFVTTGESYQLRIRSLRFRDGVQAIAPSGTTFGMITFTVGALPTLLASPTPTFFLGNQQGATQAVVDAATIWLLDANGAFVFDTVA